MACVSRSCDLPKKGILMAYISNSCDLLVMGSPKMEILMDYISRSCDLQNTANMGDSGSPKRGSFDGLGKQVM